MVLKRIAWITQTNRYRTINFIIFRAIKTILNIKETEMYHILSEIKILLFIFLTISYTGISQSINIDSICFSSNKTQHGGICVNYLPVTMPGSESKMGLMGIHCNFEFSKKIYGGFNMFAAISGERGGLFTLGIEAGMKQKIYRRIYFDASLNFGGGGGDRAPVGGGAYLNPKIGASYHYPKFSLGTQYSYINFYSGKIKSAGLTCFLEIPFSLKYVPYSLANETLNQQSMDDNEFRKIWNKNASRNVFIIQSDVFFPLGSSQNTSGEKLRQTIYLVGFEYKRYLNNKTFLFFQTDGGYKGIKAGFMDVFGGIGYHFSQNHILSLAPEIAIGAGGGGRIQTDGGLLIYPGLNISQRINSNFGIAEHVGYLFSPLGSFQALTADVSLNFEVFSGGLKSHIDGKNFEHHKFTRLQVLIENQTYIKAARIITEPITINLLALQINLDISKWGYLVGQASFAYQGESGGYAEGLFGAGVRFPLLNNGKLQFLITGLAGTGGGGDIYTNQGFILKPSGGINYSIGEKIALHGSVGKVFAPFGGLNSLHINGGLVFSFSTLMAK